MTQALSEVPPCEWERERGQQTSRRMSRRGGRTKKTPTWKSLLADEERLAPFVQASDERHGRSSNSQLAVLFSSGSFLDGRDGGKGSEIAGDGHSFSEAGEELV